MSVALKTLVELSAENRHLCVVRMFKTVLALALATIWLPMTSHCLLFETVMQSDFFACSGAAIADAAEPDRSPASDCDQDSCQVVENAQYKSSSVPVTIPPLNSQLLFEVPVPVSTPANVVQTGSNSAAENLAGLPAAWQFAVRAAPAPRAPSCIV